MNDALKSLIKKTPPMKWLLGRINKLEKALQEERNTVKQLKALNEQNTVKINRLEQALRNQNNDIRHDMRYLYYKGLHPDQYAVNLKEWYKEQTGKTLNLENPQTYNEKIQWMKLYDSTPIKTKLADKYLVREWVAGKIGEEYLIPLLGVYDKFDDIDFDELPDKFVIKTNHSWSTNKIVTDKRHFDLEAAKKFFDQKMRENFAFRALELHYKDIVPKIIIEKYLENKDNQLDDYKFMCFDGKVEFLWVDSDRFTNHKRALYTINWERMDVQFNYSPPDCDLPKPINFDKMLELATILCQGFNHVRVDLYNINGKIYFGEMTFTTEAGIGKWNPEEYDKIFGDCIKLPEKSEIPK